MPITHNLTIDTSFVSKSTLALRANLPIGIIGIAEGATFAPNTIVRVQSETDLTQFGVVDANNTLVPEIRILQSYGCNNIYAIRVPKGADAATTEANIVGTNPATGIRTGIFLFLDTFARFRERPEYLLVPNYSSNAVVAAALDVATRQNMFVVLDFPIGTTLAQATTIRGTATGLGTKDHRLIPTMPKVKNSNNAFESLATHTVGVVAATVVNKGFGFTASNELLQPGIIGIETGFSLSYRDITADNHKLENLGITTVNLNVDGYVSWGNRNALYVDGLADGIDTYKVVQKIKQKLNKDFVAVGVNFIDESSDYSTAKLLENALNNVINSNAIPGNLKPQSRATLNEAKTNFTLRSLVYDINLGVNLPVETVSILTQISLMI